MLRGLCLLLLLFLVSCNLQKPYKRPCLDIPKRWRLPTNHDNIAYNARWWHQFQDPVLDCYIRTALANNKDLKIAVHRVLQVCDEWKIVSASLYPEVDANLIVQRGEVSANATALLPGESRVSWDLNPFFSLSYEVDVWKRVQNLSDAALFDLFASVQARRIVVMGVVTAVASTYVKLRMYDAQRIIANQTLDSRLAAVKLINTRYEAGQVSLMDVRQAEAEAEDAAVTKTQLELAISLTENLLSVLLGQNPGPKVRGKTIDELQRTIYVPMGLPSELLCQRPDIMQAEDQLESTHFRVGAAKALFFPQIFLTADYGAQSTQLSNLWSGGSRTWTYGLNIVENIFDAGKIYYQFRSAKELRWQALYNYQNVIQTAFKEVDDALITENKTKELIDIESARVDTVGDYLRLSTLRYDNGETDYLTVLDAQTRLFESQLSLVGVQNDHIASYIDLYKSLGGGWVPSADCYAITRPAMRVDD